MITLEKNNSLYQQIASFYEREIAEGRLKPGDRIPPTVQLAKQLKVNPDTIQQSLKLLMTRGLLERVPGRGTFIRKGINNRTIGIIFGKEIYTNPDVMFFSIFLDSLTKVFAQNGWDCKLFSSSEFATYDKAFYDFKSAVESGELRAVVEFCSNDLIRDWIENECQVPHCQNSPVVDFVDFTQVGLNYLYERGCRNIAFLPYDFDFDVVDYRKIADEFCASRGMSEQQVSIFPCGSHAREGYNAAQEVLQKNRRTDGLLAANDGAFRGVLYALLEQGIKIPQDIKLITYANKDIDIFCHLPLTKLEVNPDCFAEQTYMEIMARLNGEKVVYTPIKVKLVPGKSCGE